MWALAPTNSIDSVPPAGPRPRPTVSYAPSPKMLLNKSRTTLIFRGFHNVRRMLNPFLGPMWALAPTNSIDSVPSTVLTPGFPNRIHPRLPVSPLAPEFPHLRPPLTRGLSRGFLKPLDWGRDRISAPLPWANVPQSAPAFFIETVPSAGPRCIGK